ncbi:SPFH domain-containing protein [Bacteroides acidifaciens]|uniref:SPFH domain-containing protein n=1 Tax=Bacteroides acidifaciens TaxID=85831 RepID=UPI0025B74BDC|nr:SPFH domain-containing protein [Bacteroides acidifaciens]
MDIVDVVKWEVSDDELVHRFSSDNIRLGSQLVVYPGQTAFLVKGGKILDEFTTGTYTIKSENIPLLGKIINLPFDGETPLKTDVWFVNMIALLDCKWGTAVPLQIEDPTYEVIVPIRAFGQYGFSIIDPRTFLERLVGNMSSFGTLKVTEYFRGVILSKLTAIIYETMKENGLSVLNINANVETLSYYAKDKLDNIFRAYGIAIELFYIISISVLENDPSFQRLKEAKDAAAEIKIIGKENYQMTRSFDVLEKAAENEGGTVGAAVGIGAGVGIGGIVGAMVGQNINMGAKEQLAIPPIPKTKYYLAIDGTKEGPLDKDVIDNRIISGEIEHDTLIWKKGMKTWIDISKIEDFKKYFEEDCPPPLPV